MNTQLAFNNNNLSVIIKNNQIWFSSKELAKALQYADGRAVAGLYNQNSDEFSPGMSEVVESTTSGNLKARSRIFSLRGAHLIAMFARTPIAKEFRKWVLDILDKEVGNPAAVQEEKQTHTLTLTDEELCSLCWLWNSAEFMRERIESVYPAMKTLGSSYAGSFYSMAFEYKRTLENARAILIRETRGLETDLSKMSRNWQNVLPRLRLES